MADRIVIVNTAGGGSYTSIQTALSMESDFAGGEDHIVFRCYGALDTGRINIIGGYTTSSAHRLKIYSMDKSGGVRNVGYRIDGAWGGYTGAIRTTLQWMEFYDLPIRNSSANGYGALLTQNCVMDRCIAYDSGRHGITCSGAGFFYLINCIVESCVYGISNNSGLLTTDGTYIYNCTVMNSTNTGIIVNASSKAWVINCYSGGNGGADTSISGSAVAVVTKTYTEDGTNGTPTLAFSTSSGVYFTNITAGSDNCNLISSLSGLIGVGIDLRTDPVYAVTIDFSGQVRPAAPAVGVFEFAGSNKSFMHYYTNLMQGNIE